MAVNKTDGFNRLHNYALLNVYDHLDFDDLVNVAAVNVQNHDLITHHHMIAKYRIHEKTIRITNSPEEDEPTEDSNILTIHNYKTVLQFFQLFGHLVTKLEFLHFYSIPEAIPTINRHIAEYCSKSLVEMRLNGAGLYLVSETERQFENLTRLTFTETNIYTDNLQLHRIYPRMEYFEIHVVRLMRMASLQSIVQPYPNLKHLSYSDRDIDGDDSFLSELFQLNPQLEALTLRKFVTLNVLRSASENLSKLKFLLVLNNFHNAAASNSIHFESVTNFTFIDRDSLNNFEQFPITFDRLEEFAVISEISIDSIERFVRENDGLKVLSIPWMDLGDNYSSLLDIVGGLSQLVEIKLEWSEKIGENDTLRLINENEQLKTVTFCVNTRDHCDLLQNIVPRSWEMNEEKTAKECTFMRTIGKDDIME